MDSHHSLSTVLRDPSASYEVKSAAIEGAVDLRGREVVAALLAALDFKQNDWRVQLAILRGLGRMGDSAAAPRLTEYLDSTDPDLRAAAAQALADIDSAEAESRATELRGARLALGEGAIPLLEDCLRDRRAKIRLRAIPELLAVGTSRARQTLLPLLQDADGQVKREAAFALAELRAVECTPVLMNVLGSADPEHRARAAESLGKTASPDAVGPLEGRLRKDSSASVRLAAVHALRAIGNSAAIAAIRVALMDEDDRVFNAAISALGDDQTRSTADALWSMFTLASRPVEETESPRLVKVTAAVEKLCIHLGYDKLLRELARLRKKQEELAKHRAEQAKRRADAYCRFLKKVENHVLTGRAWFGRRPFLTGRAAWESLTAQSSVAGAHVPDPEYEVRCTVCRQSVTVYSFIDVGEVFPGDFGDTIPNSPSDVKGIGPRSVPSSHPFRPADAG